MPRAKNPVRTRQLTIAVTERVFELLTRIAKSGYAAKTEAAVAEEMIRAGLNADGLLSGLVRSRVTKNLR